MKYIVCLLLLSSSAMGSVIIEKSQGLNFLALEAEEYNFFRDIYLHDQVEKRAQAICDYNKNGILIDYKVQSRDMTGFVVTIKNGVIDKKVIGPKNLLFIPVNPYVFDWVECEEFSIQQ